MLGGLPLIASGLFGLWFVRVFFELVRLCPAGGGRSEGHHPEGDRHRRYKAEGVLRVAEKYKRLSIFTRYSAIVVPLVPFNKSL